jgi:hypothetical protein
MKKFKKMIAILAIALSLISFNLYASSVKAEISPELITALASEEAWLLDCLDEPDGYIEIVISDQLKSSLEMASAEMQDLSSREEGVIKNIQRLPLMVIADAINGGGEE